MKKEKLQMFPFHFPKFKPSFKKVELNLKEPSVVGLKEKPILA